MITERTQLLMDKLIYVTGGDYQDRWVDNGFEPLYKLDSYVEVFNSPLHITTTRKKIVYTEKDYKYDNWLYKFEGDDHLYTANYIESQGKYQED